MVRNGRRQMTRGERGQVIVMFALLSVFMMMILAIAVETGFTWIQRRNLQNAADAAALAGAQKLPDNPGGGLGACPVSVDESTACGSAQSYADKNVDAIETDDAEIITTHVANDTIKVTVTKKADTIFAGWFAIGGKKISATATAQVRAGLLPGPGVVPLGIRNSDYVAGKDIPPVADCTQPGANCVQLKDPGGNGTTGNYGLLDISNSPGQAVCPFLQGGSVAITDPGTATQTGAHSSIRSCLDARMTAAGANQCLTLAQITDKDGKLIDRCNPLIGAKGTGNPLTQPTAVIVLPVITDDTFDPNGKKDVDLQTDTGVPQQGKRIFAFFLVDITSIQKVNNIGPTCDDNGGGGGGNPTATPTPKGTVTATPTGSTSPSPTATNTPKHPTNTPTNTPTRTNTPTPVPPTATPTPKTPLPTPTATATKRGNGHQVVAEGQLADAGGNGNGNGNGGGGGNGQCNITGQFLASFNAAVLPGGVPVGDFDDGAVVKVVQLID